MTEYVEELDTYSLPRNVNKGGLASKEMQRVMRSGNGSLQWLATNMRLDLSAEASLSSGNNTRPTVETFQNLNKLIRKAKKDAGWVLHFPSIPLRELSIGGFSDAAHGIRPDGASQGGLLLVATSHKLWEGEECLMAPLDWRS